MNFRILQLQRPAKIHAPTSGSKWARRNVTRLSRLRVDTECSTTWLRPWGPWQERDYSGENQVMISSTTQLGSRLQLLKLSNFWCSKCSNRHLWTTQMNNHYALCSNSKYKCSFGKLFKYRCILWALIIRGFEVIQRPFNFYDILLQRKTLGVARWTLQKLLVLSILMTLAY